MSGPTEKHIKVLRAVSRIEGGNYEFINVGDAEECIDAGWLEPVGTMLYSLTERGRAVLDSLDD